MKYTPKPHGKILCGNFTQNEVHIPPSNSLQTVPSSPRIPVPVKLLLENSP